MIKQLIFALFITLMASFDIPVTYREGNPLYIQGKVNQFVNIEIPYKHILSAQISKKDLRNKLFFSPNIFMFKPIKLINHPQSQNISLLQELRTPFSNKFTHLFKLRQYLIAFRFPNHFSIFKEQATTFKIIKYFDISQMIGKEIKFQKINQDYIMVLISTEKILFLNEETYFIKQNPMKSTDIIIFQTFSSNDNQVTKMNDNILSFNNNLIILKHNQFQTSIPFLKSQYNLTIYKAYLQRRQDKILCWIIDNYKGIYMISMSQSYNKVSQPKLIVDNPEVIDIDIKKGNNNNDEIVILLTCKSNMFKYFKEVYLNKNYEHIKTTEAINSTNQNIKKYLYYDNKILSLQKQSLNIFLPSLYKYQKDIQYIQSNLNMPAISNFDYMIQHHHQGYESLHIYTIDNKMMTRYDLIMENYSLLMKFTQEIQTKFDLLVDYICQESFQRSVKRVCGYQIEVHLNVHQKILSFQKWKSIVIGSAFIIVAVMVVLIFLCYKKYSLIERNVWLQVQYMSSQKGKQKK